MSSCTIFQHALLRPPCITHLSVEFLCFSIDFPRSETLPHAHAGQKRVVRSSYSWQLMKQLEVDLQ
jgi:hypothetical protein